MDALPLEVLSILVAVAAMAGMIDAIAGGGGLLALPALLWAGLPPVQALATNKLQGTFGTMTASFNFVRRGEIDLRRLRIPVLMTFIGSAAGTLAVQRLGSEMLERIVPTLLIVFAFSAGSARPTLRAVCAVRCGRCAPCVVVDCGLTGCSVGMGCGVRRGRLGPT